MPQPIKSGCTLHYYPGLVKERPNHAIGIALVASEWAALEDQLILLFKYALLGFGSWGYPLSRGIDPSIIAQSAWEAMDSLKPRLEFIESVAKEKISPELFKEYVEDLKPEIRKRAAERNRVVHGHWQTSPEYPDDLILVSSVEVFRYTVKDFEDIALRINGTLSKIANYWNRVAGQVNPALHVESQPPPLPLRES